MLYQLSYAPNGGDEEARTPDIQLAKLALYQLSYIPVQRRYVSAPPGKSLCDASRTKSPPLDPASPYQMGHLAEKIVSVLRNSPPAQRALMLLNHDPPSFWQALHSYLRSAGPNDVAAALRASVSSLDAENRSQLALFISGHEGSSSQELASSREALTPKIERLSTHPGFKASVEDFLRANPRAVAQLSSRLLQDLLVAAENPQIAEDSRRANGSGEWLFPDNDHRGAAAKGSLRFTLPSWVLPLGAFFIGSIVTALVINSLFGRRSATQTLVAPLYLATASPGQSPAQRLRPSEYSLPARGATQQFATAPPLPSGPLRDFVGSGAGSFEQYSNGQFKRSQKQGKGPDGPQAISTGQNGSPQPGVVTGSPAPNRSSPQPAAAETPYSVAPEDQTFVSVPHPSPAAAASLNPSNLLLVVPTPQPPPPPTASPAPTPTPVPKSARIRIRLGYHCAKCP